MVCKTCYQNGSTFVQHEIYDMKTINYIDTQEPFAASIRKNACCCGWSQWILYSQIKARFSQLTTLTMITCSHEIVLSVTAPFLYDSPI